MPDRRTHRGPHPEDARLFGVEALPRLRAAAADFCWLLDRGYAHDSGLKLVGDRYALVARQRTAVSRCSCSGRDAAGRQEREVGWERLSGAALWLDGYNVLTTVEAALAGGVLLIGRDGACRDMASMHGSYRKVAETLPALELIGETLVELSGWGGNSTGGWGGSSTATPTAAVGVAECRWLLDRPVSNSGRLKGIIEELAAARGWPWRVELVANPDDLLAEAGRFAGAATQPPPRPSVIVATADSAVLDRGPPWINLAAQVVRGHVPAARIIELAGRVS